MALLSAVHLLLRRDEDFMKHHVQRCASLIRYSTARLDKETVLGAMEQDGLALEFVNRPPNRYAQDADVVRAAVRQNGLALRFASEVLREDVQMVREALESDERALKFVSPKDLVCKLVSERPSALKHAQWEPRVLKLSAGSFFLFRSGPPNKATAELICP